MTSRIIPEAPALDILQSINVENSSIANAENLKDIGGIEGLIDLLQVDVRQGLSNEQLRNFSSAYGDNTLPEMIPRSFWEILFDAFSDTSLIILVCAAIVSIVVSEANSSHSGWIEGSAILIAVFLVASATASNHYTKQNQFLQLEATSKRDEQVCVLRNSVDILVHPDELVVGDIIQLQVSTSMSRMFIVDSMLAGRYHSCRLRNPSSTAICRQGQHPNA